MWLLNLPGSLVLYFRKTTSITVVIDNIIERQLWDDAEEEQRNEAVRNMEQPYVIKQREKRSREGKPRADRPHGNNNRRKSDASYEVCDYSQKRLSPVLKDDDNVVPREEADNQEQQSVSNNPRREEEEYREASPFDTGASEIGRKLASTNIGGNSRKEQQTESPPPAQPTPFRPIDASHYNLLAL